MIRLHVRISDEKEKTTRPRSMLNGKKYFQMISPVLMTWATTGWFPNVAASGTQCMEILKEKEMAP